MKQEATDLTLVRSIETRILLVRGQKVMLDSDLAEVYGVETKRLKEQVKRNSHRFPPDFMFQLTLEEVEELQTSSRSQIATLNQEQNNFSSEKQEDKRGQNIKYRPFVFTEHGTVMLASVLNSPVAVEASIQVVRAFIRLRNLSSEHKELQARLDELEKKYDSQFKTVFIAIRELMKPTPKDKRKIGFMQTQNQLFDEK